MVQLSGGNPGSILGMLRMANRPSIESTIKSNFTFFIWTTEWAPLAQRSTLQSDSWKIARLTSGQNSFAANVPKSSKALVSQRCPILVQVRYWVG
jgi:hypothetical protein